MSKSRAVKTVIAAGAVTGVVFGVAGAFLLPQGWGMAMFAPGMFVGAIVAMQVVKRMISPRGENSN